MERAKMNHSQFPQANALQAFRFIWQVVIGLGRVISFKALRLVYSCFLFSHASKLNPTLTHQDFIEHQTSIDCYNDTHTLNWDM